MIDSKAQSQFLSRAKAFLSPDSLVTAADEIARFASDWTRLPASPGPVVLPRTTAEVAQVLKLCQELRYPVVPSGGRTGLAGGAVAAHGEVVLNLSKMQRLDAVDTRARTVRVQAGATTQSVHEHCAKHGLLWPIDLASKGSSQIGGNLSTNAGGVRVIRYGMTRRWVTSLQAVTVSGEILELSTGLEKNNTGYDLIQLLIGSEGTLAVITEATLKLVRLPESISVFLFGMRGVKEALRLYEAARRGPFEILAFEFFSRRCQQAVSEKLGRWPRFDAEHPFYCLLEIESENGEVARTRTEEWLAEIMEKALVDDGMIARSSEERKEVWGLREGITESLQMTAPLKKYDVSVPLAGIESFLKAVEEKIHSLRLQLDLYLFGHLGDGSPHLNLLKPASATAETFEQDAARFESELFPLLKACHGSVSAEHGVGVLKKNWVQYSRSPEELRLFQQVKRAFDPQGLLNPGKVIDC
jgi:FAD/FMN-containing dehydrogenase